MRKDLTLWGTSLGTVVKGLVREHFGSGLEGRPVLGALAGQESQCHCGQGVLSSHDLGVISPPHEGGHARPVARHLWHEKAEVWEASAC